MSTNEDELVEKSTGWFVKILLDELEAELREFEGAPGNCPPGIRSDPVVPVVVVVVLVVVLRFGSSTGSEGFLCLRDMSYSSCDSLPRSGDSIHEVNLESERTPGPRLTLEWLFAWDGVWVFFGSRGTLLTLEIFYIYLCVMAIAIEKQLKTYCLQTSKSLIIKKCAWS